MPRTPRRIGRWFAAVVAAITLMGGYAVTGANPFDAPARTSGTGTAHVAANVQLTDADLAWSGADYPDYYRVLGAAQDVDDEARAGIRYSDLDRYGRATGAGGWITGAMRAEARGRDRDDAPDPADPAGWPQRNPEATIPGTDGRRTYHGRLWNRSHLIAWSLGGSMDAENIVPGTRTQNVGDNVRPGGMAYTEALARDWLDAHPNGMLWYAATPIYQGSELIPRAVVVDIQTDDGSISERVLVYNAANDWTIDYATGDAQRTS